MIGYIVAAVFMVYYGNDAVNHHRYADAAVFGVIVLTLGLFAIASAIVDHTREVKKQNITPPKH